MSPTNRRHPILLVLLVLVVLPLLVPKVLPVWAINDLLVT